MGPIGMLDATASLEAHLVLARVFKQKTRNRSSAILYNIVFSYSSEHRIGKCISSPKD